MIKQKLHVLQMAATMVISTNKHLTALVFAQHAHFNILLDAMVKMDKLLLSAAINLLTQHIQTPLTQHKNI